MIARENVRGAFPVVPLGELVEFLDHKRRPVKQADRVDGPYPYYGANGQQGSIDGYLFDEPLVLVAEDGGHFDDPERGIAYQISGKTWVNNHAHVLRPKDTICIRFLTRVLENYDVQPFISGTTRGKLTKGQAQKIEIPLPPLEEQKRIAAILDQADALRRLRRRALDRLNTLGQAIFHEMFGHPNQKGRRVRLGHVCDVRDGTHDSPKYVEQGFPLLTSKNFSSGQLNPAGAKMISREDYEAINKRSKVDVGDIVMPMIGTIGSPVIVRDEPHFAIKNVALIKFGSGSPCAEYVRALLSGQFLDEVIRRQGKGGTQKFISLGDLRGIEFFEPPIECQRAFSSAVGQMEAELATAQRAGISAENLFTSLQHRAFRGEL